MQDWYIVFGITFALLLAVQVILAVKTLRRLLTPDGPLLADPDCPPAMVLLCLRGGDPFLHRTLSRLAQQDYPNYRVRIMLDSEQDEAAVCVRDAFGETFPANFEVRILQHRYDTCTYKMSAILEATQDLPPELAVLALLDGDSVLHRSWLRELASPIVRGETLVTTGNRWYIPDRATLPNLVRFWWASFALPLMYVLQFPFGGSMAVRPDIIRDERLRSRIRHAFSEDTTIGQFVNELGHRVEFQRTLVINNGEDISLRGLFNFNTRQLLAVRMQHSGWKWLGSYGLLGSAWVAYPILRGWFPFEPWIIFIFRSLLAVMFLQTFLQDWAIRRILKARGERHPWWNPWRLVLSVLGLAVVPFINTPAVFRAYLTRRINWRGVIYRLNGNPPVQVEADLWQAHAAPSATPQTPTRAAV
ncbi:MAG: glycosyltransferase family 2 protein [Planctomycetaceae bacterium]|nr:glycosyltransferase family 2 protein [Planctomycetaceae bacterium]